MLRTHVVSQYPHLFVLVSFDERLPDLVRQHPFFWVCLQRFLVNLNCFLGLEKNFD